MSEIHILNQDTINKIAAGEVVERPMAVVKELIENAIDAGADSITVQIKDGGKGLIRVTDNGSGISLEEIRLAFTPHATSKIASANDLLSVSTLGFRGEALASIAAVSQLELVTKTEDSLLGCRYLIDGGEEKELTDVGCPQGSTFLIRNLFYNTPARLKFLKTSQTEAGYINTLIERMALSHPQISFRFINQEQPKLNTSGNGKLEDVIYHIYGREISSHMLPVNADEAGCYVEGFVGEPVISRGNRNFMNYFINGRYIRSTTIQRAIEDAYEPYSMKHHHPFTVLHFTVDAGMVDINVHPQKMEIRFTDAQQMYQSVFHAVSEVLKHRELIPEVPADAPVSTGYKPSKTPEPFEINRIHASMPISTQEEQAAASESHDIPKQSAEHSDSHSAPEQSTEFSDRHTTPKQSTQINQFKETPPDYASVVAASVNKPEQESFFDSGILSEQAVKEIRIIGQVFDTYWILQYGNGMYLIDQHAAHEKVLYERFMKQLSEKEPMTQLLQPPVILTVSMQEQQVLTEHMDILQHLGYQIEPFGGREYAVTGVPAHLPTVSDASLLKEVIDTLVDNHARSTPELLMDKVASMSCKAAVKGNHELPREQTEKLLQELMTLENPYHCPHGRPTMIKMTKTELEKKFKRII